MRYVKARKYIITICSLASRRGFLIQMRYTGINISMPLLGKQQALFCVENSWTLNMASPKAKYQTCLKTSFIILVFKSQPVIHNYFQKLYFIYQSYWHISYKNWGQLTGTISNYHLHCFTYIKCKFICFQPFVECF